MMAGASAIVAEALTVEPAKPTGISGVISGAGEKSTKQDA
jgi:hypothetical protein